MTTSLTPAALHDLEELLKGSRRFLGEIYREQRAGVSLDEMAKTRGHRDLKRVRDTMSAIRILFGRESLPKRGNGRQAAINEAAALLNSNLLLSDELTAHFEEMLRKADRTNTRKVDNYVMPAPPAYRSVYAEARDNLKEGNLIGVYVIGTYSEADLRLVKIGWSNNVWDRVANAQTWSPEKLEVLRVYPCPNPNFFEGRFHVALDTLGLSLKNEGGTEWFTVKMELIDAIADSLGLVNVQK